MSLFGKRIRERRIGHELPVGERLEERDEVGALAVREGERLQELAPERALAALLVEADHLLERGDVGVTIDTTKVPVREEGMTPYETLLSESQERMLVVAKKGHESQVKAILGKWDLAAEVIGEVIAEPVYRVTEGSRVVAEFPGTRLVTDCPQYHPEAKESAEAIARRERDVHAILRLTDADPEVGLAVDAEAGELVHRHDELVAERGERLLVEGDALREVTHGEAQVIDHARTINDSCTMRAW